jgi:hypothetical protein
VFGMKGKTATQEEIKAAKTKREREKERIEKE